MKVARYVGCSLEDEAMQRCDDFSSLQASKIVCVLLAQQPSCFKIELIPRQRHVFSRCEGWHKSKRTIGPASRERRSHKAVNLYLPYLATIGSSLPANHNPTNACQRREHPPSWQYQTSSIMETAFKTWGKLFCLNTLFSRSG